MKKEMFEIQYKFIDSSYIISCFVKTDNVKEEVNKLRNYYSCLGYQIDLESVVSRKLEVK